MAFKKRHIEIAFLVILVIAYGVVFGIDSYTRNEPSQGVQQEVPSAGYTEDLINAPEEFSLPQYEGEPWTVMNGNAPYMDDTDFSSTSITLSEMDILNRCGIAEAILGPDTLPEGERGEIGHVKPSGWHTVKYNDLIDGNYLYNRCHLIAWSLSGLNDDERNLITGTRYLNIQGMWTYEEQVLDYIRNTDNKVHYRSSPVFVQDELVARGVLLEACSEDRNLMFCVFLHNVQPGIKIDYATGKSHATEEGYAIKERYITP